MLSRFPVPVQLVQSLNEVLKVCAKRPVASDNQCHETQELALKSSINMVLT